MHLLEKFRGKRRGCPDWLRQHSAALFDLNILVHMLSNLVDECKNCCTFASQAVASAKRQQEEAEGQGQRPDKPAGTEDDEGQGTLNHWTMQIHGIVVSCCCCWAAGGRVSATKNHHTSMSRTKP